MIMNTNTKLSLEKQLEEYRFALSKVSHEIRNPVTLINSSLQLMEKEHPEFKQYDLWQNVMEDMQFLRRLLDDLSAYNNTYRCQLVKTQMGPWLSKLAESIPLLFTNTHIHYNVNISDSLPCALIDTLKLNQALTNLLRNAFEAAETQVSFLAYQKENSLCLEIYNDGTPISFEQKQEIFTPFVTTKSEGTGLGLPIAKGIINSHNGSLILDSSKEGETRFLVSLPLC